FKLGIDAAFEKLVQEGAIKVEVTDFTTDQDAKDKEKWALDFFKDKLLTDWFEPTLAPGKISGGAADASTLGPTPTPTPTPTPKPTPAGGQGQAQPAARLATDSTTPTPLPAGHTMVHVPAATGTRSEEHT